MRGVGMGITRGAAGVGDVVFGAGCDDVCPECQAQSWSFLQPAGIS